MVEHLPTAAATGDEYQKAYDTLDFLAGMIEAETWSADRQKAGAARLPLVVITLIIITAHDY